MALAHTVPSLSSPSLRTSKQHAVCPAAHRRAGTVRPQRAAIRRPLCITAAAAGYTNDLADAEQRWNNQLRDGRVKSVTAKTAGQLMKDDWVLLDVRPPTEVEKAGVKGAVEVPLYVPETSMSFGGLLKNATAFGMGGWWLGGVHLNPNPAFMRDVTSRVPKDANIIVTCQKGLRSLAAAEQLSKAGYGQLAWINGGLDSAQKGDLDTERADDLRYGGIGGLSEALGWTEVQRQDTKSEGFLGGSATPIKIAILILALDALLFGTEQLQFILKAQGQ